MVVVLLFCLLASPALLAADAKTIEAVKTADRVWADATVKGDAAALQNLLADDLTYTHSNGETDSKKIYIENLSGARKYHKVGYESLDARLFNAAHLCFVHFWIHQNGRWQLVAHQSLRLPN